MMVYMAGAIDMIQFVKDGDAAKTWKAKAKEELNKSRISNWQRDQWTNKKDTTNIASLNE